LRRAPDIAPASIGAFSTHRSPVSPPAHPGRTPRPLVRSITRWRSQDLAVLLDLMAGHPPHSGRGLLPGPGGQARGALRLLIGGFTAARCCRPGSGRSRARRPAGIRRTWNDAPAPVGAGTWPDDRRKAPGTDSRLLATRPSGLGGREPSEAPTGEVRRGAVGGVHRMKIRAVAAVVTPHSAAFGTVTTSQTTIPQPSSHTPSAPAVRRGSAGSRSPAHFPGCGQVLAPHQVSRAARCRTAGL
jgi:hypothetical protein